jgi:hypothetical protein
LNIGIISAQPDALVIEVIHQLTVAAFDGCKGKVPQTASNVKSSIARVVINVFARSPLSVSPAGDLRLEKMLYQFHLLKSAPAGHVIGSVGINASSTGEIKFCLPV